MKGSRAIFGAAAMMALAATASADFIYGLNRSNEGGGIYRIDVSTGAASLVGSTVNIGQQNGLAFDAASLRLYYGSSTDNRTLVRFDANTNTTTTLTGTLAKASASGAFYGGAYYYVSQNTRELRRVTFAGNAIASETVVVSGTGGGWGFGDIAINRNGIVYGSTTNNTYFSADLNNASGGFTIISNSHGDRLQLGYYGNALYGVGSDDDKIFSVNALTGARTHISTLQNTNLYITDAADAVPEPTTMIGLALGAAALIRRRRKS
jgi:hypothetical protein